MPPIWSLLLPKRLVNEFVRDALATKGFRSIDDVLRAGSMEQLVRDLVRTFDVSMQLVTYRLRELGTLPKNLAQAALELEG